MDQLLYTIDEYSSKPPLQTYHQVWFTSLGLSHPLHTSPADFIMDHANIDYDKAKLFGQTFQDTHDLHKVNRLSPERRGNWPFL